MSLWPSITRNMASLAFPAMIAAAGCLPAYTLADGLLPPKPYHYVNPPPALRSGNTAPTAGQGTIPLIGGRSVSTFIFTHDGQAGINVPAGAFVAAPPATTVSVRLQPVQTPIGLPKTRPDKTFIVDDGNAYSIVAVGLPGNRPAQVRRRLTLIMRWPYPPLSIYQYRNGSWRELCFADTATYSNTTMSCSTSSLGTFLPVSTPRLPLANPTPTPVISTQAPLLSGPRVALAIVLVMFSALLILIVWRMRRRSDREHP